MRKIYTCLLVLLIIIAGCKTESNGPVIEIDLSKALDTPGEFKLSDLVTDAEIITLDTTVREAFFLNVASLNITEHYLCFSCNSEKRVYLFDRAGKFIRNIGWQGKGPGEFVIPGLVAVSPDEKYVVVGDEMARKLLLYSMEGKFIREHKIADDTPGFAFESAIFIDPSNFVVSFRRSPTPSDNFASLLQYDLGFKVVRRILQRSASPEEAMPNLGYQSFARTETGFFFWETYKDTVYYINKEGSAEPAYHLLVRNHCQDKRKNGSALNSPAAVDLCTQVMDVTDLPGFLIMSIIKDDGYRAVVYDKLRKEAFSVDHPSACETNGNSWIKTSLVNDVFGIEPVQIQGFNPERGEIVCMVRPGWIVDTHDMTCVRKREVTLPAIRDRLADICGSGRGFEDIVILVLKLKPVKH